MQSFRLFFGLALGLAMMLAGLLLEGGHVALLLSVPAAVVVGGGTLGAAIIANPFKSFGYAFNAVFRSAKLPRAEADAATRVFAAAGKGALLSGFLGAILGAIHVFTNLDKPEFIGPGVALAIISIAYGFGINVFLAQPFASLARAKIQPVSKGVTREHAHRNESVDAVRTDLAA